MNTTLKLVVDDAPTGNVQSPLSDAQVVERIRSGERARFEILMRRHNQKVYRVVRAVFVRLTVSAAVLP